MRSNPWLDEVRTLSRTNLCGADGAGVFRSPAASDPNVTQDPSLLLGWLSPWRSDHMICSLWVDRAKRQPAIRSNSVVDPVACHVEEVLALLAGLRKSQCECFYFPMSHRSLDQETMGAARSCAVSFSVQTARASTLECGPDPAFRSYPLEGWAATCVLPAERARWRSWSLASCRRFRTRA